MLVDFLHVFPQVGILLLQYVQLLAEVVIFTLGDVLDRLGLVSQLLFVVVHLFCLFGEDDFSFFFCRFCLFPSFCVRLADQGVYRGVYFDLGGATLEWAITCARFVVRFIVAHDFGVVHV